MLDVSTDTAKANISDALAALVEHALEHAGVSPEQLARWMEEEEVAGAVTAATIRRAATFGNLVPGLQTAAAIVSALGWELRVTLVEADRPELQRQRRERKAAERARQIRARRERGGELDSGKLARVLRGTR